MKEQLIALRSRRVNDYGKRKRHLRLLPLSA
jgi:hypothetical protein